MHTDEIRAMTPGENHSWFVLGKWPCCGGSEYLRGPSGGCSVNIECPSCGMRLNVMDPEMGLGDGGFGQVIRQPLTYTPPQDPPAPQTPIQRIWDWFYRFMAYEAK